MSSDASLVMQLGCRSSPGQHCNYELLARRQTLKATPLLAFWPKVSDDAQDSEWAGTLPKFHPSDIEWRYYEIGIE